MNNKLLIVGAGGHAKVVCDLAKNYYKNIVVADDKATGQLLGCKIIGTLNEVKQGERCDFIVAIGSNEVREKIFTDLIEQGFTPVSLIHPTATIGEGVQIGVGSVVFAGAVINACAKVGIGCIVNTMASIDHDCEVGEFSHLAVASHFAGTVKCGKNCFFGTNSAVINNVSICDNVIIGAGATVVKDVLEQGTYVGTPCKKIK